MVKRRRRLLRPCTIVVSSGRVRTARRRAGTVSIPATQTPPIQPPALESPHVESNVQTAPNQSALDPTLEFIRNFDFSSAMAGADTPMQTSSLPSVSDPSLFEFTASNFDTPLPAAGPAIPTQASSISDPALFGFAMSDFNNPLPVEPNVLDEFMAYCQSAGIFFADPDTTSNVATGVADHFTSLPPPPPESPPAMQLPVEEFSEPGLSAPRSRRGPRNEGIDMANVISSTRTRAPSSRKRGPDEDIAGQSKKKSKSG
ncbi:hypothetical protein B0H16DRAFT_331186 [Mycena metata]|uniref:Uncharacterized protein n=1 Tax=Mycena metata TaxID=1033252 RepID=A0AAD7HM58_9AGAR|nr:hypothetical protein B0H16DRAFT_331186 [Mycena metata]